MNLRESERDPSAFARALGAFNGARYLFDAGSSQMLRFMLERSEGCDAWLSSRRFEIRFGWHPARHRYFVDTAPGIMSRLLDLTKAPVGESRLQAVIGPETIQKVGTEKELRTGGFFPAWSFGLRRVWVESTSMEIAVRVRSAESEDVGRRGTRQPLPEPIEFEQQVLELSDSFPCPNCAVYSSTFRQLRDGYLVCAACGRSFELGQM